MSDMSSLFLIGSSFQRTLLKVCVSLNPPFSSVCSLLFLSVFLHFLQICPLLLLPSALLAWERPFFPPPNATPETDVEKVSDLTGINGTRIIVAVRNGVVCVSVNAKVACFSAQCHRGVLLRCVCVFFFSSLEDISPKLIFKDVFLEEQHVFQIRFVEYFGPVPSTAVMTFPFFTSSKSYFPICLKNDC